MLRAMYAGISGLQTNQNKLDVIGNNIANVSTTAFKSQRINFQDTLSQNISPASGPGANVGGTNPIQVGLGAQVGGIDTLTSQGDMQPTSRNLDFAVDGTGFFVVGAGTVDKVLAVDPATSKIDPANTTISDVKYTRDGAFTLDSNGSLLTQTGYRVMGYALKNDTDAGPSIAYAAGNTTATVNYVNGDDPTLAKMDDNLVPLAIPKTVTNAAGASLRVQSFSVDSNGVIKAVLSDNTIAALGQISMASFSNDAGLNNVGKNMYQKTANSGDAYFRTAVGEPSDTANDSAYGNIREGYLEMSNVDLSQQFTDMIIASRAFQANGKIITTSDDILQDLVNLKR